MPPTIGQENKARQVMHAGNKPVHIINRSTKEFKDGFDGQRYLIKGAVIPAPGSPEKPRFGVLLTTADHAWHWFGRPELKTDNQEWNREVRRVMNRNQRAWESRLNGDLCVLEWICEYGRGKDFYSNSEMSEEVFDVESNYLTDDQIQKMVGGGGAGDVMLGDAEIMAEEARFKSSQSLKSAQQAQADKGGDIEVTQGDIPVFQTGRRSGKP